MKTTIRSIRPVHFLLWLLLFTGSLLFQGCLGVKSYVDRELPKVACAELKAPAAPQPLAIKLEFQTNGKPNQRATKLILPKVTHALETSKLFSALITTNAAGPSAPAQLDLVLNNVGDIGDAVGKGVGTGLTFGAAGSLVTDHYVFTAKFAQAGKEPFARTYKHAIHSTVGNKKGPEGLAPVTTAQAVDQVIEDLVFNLLKDLQTAGRL